MKIVKIPAAILLALLIFTCDAFIAPKKDRENPLDDNNPVAAVINFKATFTSSTDALITWEVDPEKNLPAGIIIIGNRESESTSIDDYYLKFEGDFRVDDLSYQVTGIDSDTVWYFSAWTHDIDKEHFTFSGSDSADTTPKTVELEPVLDGYVRYDYISFEYYVDFTESKFYVGYDTYYLYLSLMKFDQEEMQVFEHFANAELSLYYSMGSAMGTNQIVDVHRIALDWDDETIDYNQANAGDFIIYDGYIPSNTIDSVGWYVWDVTEYVQTWLDNPEKNFGLLLRIESPTDYLLFDSSEGSYKPKLIINGYN